MNDPRVTELAQYSAGLRFADLTPEAVHECRRRIIDSLACAVGAFDAEPARIARAVARRSVGRPPARLWGTQEETTVEMAAFANGVALRYADYNDAYFMRSSGHPSDNVAAVLALADALGSDGQTATVALTLAYEVFCNFSDVLPRETGYDYVIHGVVGSAVAGAKLLGLDEKQTAQAIALSIIPNVALEQTRLGELSMWKGCAAANAARNGLFAAMLAAEGLTGPEQSLTGKWGLRHAVGDFEWASFGGRGAPFRVTQTHLKYFPAVVHSQSPITAAMKLQGRFAVDNVAAVEVDTYWVARRYTDRTNALWHPTTRETADHSLPYIIAVALLDGTVTAESFSEERLGDARIARLMDCMSLREVPEYTAAHPKSWPCRIIIRLKDGTELTGDAQYFKGHALNPMTDAEVEDKFSQLTAGRLDATQRKAVLAAGWKFDAAPVRSLVDLLRFPD